MKSGTKTVLASTSFIVAKGHVGSWDVPLNTDKIQVEVSVNWDPPESEKNTIKWNFIGQDLKLVVYINGPIHAVLASTSESCYFAEANDNKICFVMIYGGTSTYCGVHLQVEIGE
ncbi:MAG: hypothetical protein ORN51_04480 [Akkermansiaceae bacterium]|nr:hypothetical protein [Akkermansiaceae bacterium]